MRLLTRLLGGLLGLLMLAVLAALLYVFLSTRAQVTGRAELRGLQGPVTVTRDRWGVPHIHAQASDTDAVFALGYVHAQDRLWQMDFQRRVAQGRLSEVLGGAALEKDRFLRTWGFYRAAQEALPALNARSRSLLAAYSAGVNAGIAEGQLPLEFRILGFTPESWTEVDSLAWAKMMAFDLGGNWEEELDGQLAVDRLGPQALRELYPPYPQGAPTILSEQDVLRAGLGGRSPVREGSAGLAPGTRAELRAQARLAAELGFGRMPDKGSNDWVISGRFTQSGRPLLADDPHLGLQAPMLWYLAEVRGPTLRTIGATIPGLPAVVIGRNDRIAWGVTNTDPDVQDLFVLPEGAPVTTREEVIRVKGQPDVRVTVETSEFGPVISGAGGAFDTTATRGQKVALRWTALDAGDTTMDAFVGVNYARNWEEFTQALRSYVTPMQNFVYADVDGNIGYYAPGRVPVRASGDGSLPVPAGPGHAWTGWVPFEELPHAYNPPSGVIVTANNRVVPDAYRHFLSNDGSWAAPYRAQRIEQLVKGRTDLTVQDMTAAQMDTLSLLWRDLRPALLATRAAGELEREALAALRAWDGRADPDSVGAAVFGAWYAQLTRMANDELGRESGQWNEPVFIVNQLREGGTYCRNEAAGTRDCAALLSSTLSAATGVLQGRLGDDVNDWRWERLHRTASRHGALGGVRALGWIWNRSVPSAGGVQTVNVSGMNLDTFQQTHAASYRHVVDLADLNGSRYVGTLGQSGNPLSAHYADQQPLWQRGEYVPMSTREEDWGSRRVLTLVPAR